MICSRSLTSLPFIVLASTVFAQDSRFSAEFSVEIESDFTFESDESDAELTDTFATIEGALGYQFTNQFSLQSTLVFEPVEDATNDRFFEDQGLYAEELFLEYDFGAASVAVGKFNPGFGFAWDIAPGVFGVDFAEDYEITERVGAAVTVPFSGIGGTHELSFYAFTTDRSFLSNSLITERGQLRLEDGGVSNTDGIESFVLSLAGSFGDTAYTFALQNQASGEGDAADQSGAVLGLVYLLNAGSKEIELLGEVAYFDEFDGTTDSATYATIGAAVPVGPVVLSAVLASRDFEGASADTLATVSAEWPLADNLGVSLAYRYGDEEGVKSQTLGALLAYEF
ncbi:hypothetical protein HW561_20560 [Rhodobacteraceae bacterium B1Z28]|uniref:Porin n=1 Tax=Ruegeria haliotis TaxID=2747601 RepID=A0ABX2PYX8_9RHOB|nr:hypothetical protein [Ruegeria haliotis]NVO58189.1 hypothetical protein [Ruegeria haliotis]